MIQSLHNFSGAAAWTAQGTLTRAIPEQTFFLMWQSIWLYIYDAVSSHSFNGHTKTGLNQTFGSISVFSKQCLQWPQFNSRATWHATKGHKGIQEVTASHPMLKRRAGDAAVELHNIPPLYSKLGKSRNLTCAVGVVTSSVIPRTEWKIEVDASFFSCQ